MTAAGAERNAVAALRALVDSRSGGEHRPQQEALAAAVERALDAGEHALLQAGTGTGKSLGYLIPAAMSGKRVVIATATKQLGEQLMQTDLPTVARLLPTVTGRSFSYRIVKGRHNYLCKARVAEVEHLGEQEAARDEPPEESLSLFELASPAPAAAARAFAPVASGVMGRLLDWAQTTVTGDRSEAPAGVTERVWQAVSIDAVGCPGAAGCPFGVPCFTERARRDARSAQIVVTSHALVAQDLRSPSPILGEWDTVVFDEAHQLEEILGGSWAAVVRPAAMRAAVAVAARRLPKGADGERDLILATGLVAEVDALAEQLERLPAGTVADLPEALRQLLDGIAVRLAALRSQVDDAARSAGDEDAAAGLTGAGQAIGDARAAVVAVRADDPTRARWIERDRREGGAGELRSAPLFVGPELVRLLGSRTLVATSATLAVAGDFTPLARTLGLTAATPPEKPGGPERPPRTWTGVDVGTPFDYERQAILYVPDPTTFPAPVGRERTEHTAAVLEELAILVRAAGGRTLALFTTAAAATHAAEHLRRTVHTPVLAQGDAPVGQLVQAFAADESTTLCGTMGLWHGVDVPGSSLSCLVLDKLPFAPMDDPLMAARRRAADLAGHDGFTEVYVANAAVKITQGVGRLIRTSTDRGVVAILDTRLRTKGYGSVILRSLPPMRVFTDRDLVVAALARLAAGQPRPATPPRPRNQAPTDR
jgi:ATP-dependent DNA helicase DinG